MTAVESLDSALGGQTRQLALVDVDRRAARALELARTTISDLARDTRARELQAAPDRRAAALR